MPAYVFPGFRSVPSVACSYPEYEMLPAKSFIEGSHRWTTFPVSSRKATLHSLEAELEASLLFTADFVVESMKRQY